MDENLPQEYVPASLRGVKPRKNVQYAGTYPREGITISWNFGPHDELLQTLNWVPLDPSARPQVCRLELDGTNTIIYRWKAGRWVKEAGL